MLADTTKEIVHTIEQYILLTHKIHIKAGWPTIWIKEV